MRPSQAHPPYGLLCWFHFLFFCILFFSAAQPLKQVVHAARRGAPQFLLVGVVRCNLRCPVVHEGSRSSQRNRCGGGPSCDGGSLQRTRDFRLNAVLLSFHPSILGWVVISLHFSSIKLSRYFDASNSAVQSKFRVTAMSWCYIAIFISFFCTK